MDYHSAVVNPARILLMALVVALASPAQAGSLLVTVEGMSCAGCNHKLSGALEALPFLADVNASFSVQGACGSLSGAADEAAVKETVAGLGYTFGSAKALDVCPEGLRGVLPEPWANRGAGADVKTISHGEEVDIEGHLADGKYTIIDFGASWCAPCHEAAETIATYLATHDDVAVRAIELGGGDPAASYQQPVVAQHLQYVDGVPWLVVRAPDGRKLLQTRSPEKALAAIDKHRGRRGK